MNNYSYQFYGRRKGRGYNRINKKNLDLNNFLLNKDDINKYKSFKHNILEIGFGNAENLINMSTKFSNINFIGAEPYLNSCQRIFQVIEKKKSQKYKNLA